MTAEQTTARRLRLTDIKLNADRMVTIDPSIYACLHEDDQQILRDILQEHGYEFKWVSEIVLLQQAPHREDGPRWEITGPGPVTHTVSEAHRLRPFSVTFLLARQASVTQTT